MYLRLTPAAVQALSVPLLRQVSTERMEQRIRGAVDVGQPDRILGPEGPRRARLVD